MDAQWTPRFEDLKHRVESSFRSDSRDFVAAVHRDLEQSKSSIYALLDTPRPNEAHRAQLKLGKRLFLLYPAQHAFCKIESRITAKYIWILTSPQPLL